MKQMPKISVIFPVYNVAEYLEQSLRSILEQAYKNIEIIAINDGSTDNSLAILETIAQQDTRIKVYSQNNQGVAKTRMNALVKCTGEYVCFVDSDDIIPYDGFTVLVHRIVADNADIVIGAYIEKTNAKEVTKEVAKVAIMDVESSLDIVLKQEVSNALWAKLFRLQLFKHVELVEYKVGEDRILLIQAISKSTRVSFINDVTYIYIVRENSASGKYKYSNVYLLHIYEAAYWVYCYINKMVPDFPEYKNDMFLYRFYIDLVSKGGAYLITAKQRSYMENVFHKIRKKLTKRALLWHFLIKNEYLYKIGLLVAKFRLKLKRNR